VSSNIFQRFIAGYIYKKLEENFTANSKKAPTSYNNISTLQANSLGLAEEISRK
jgi:hypothetical protein